MWWATVHSRDTHSCRRYPGTACRRAAPGAGGRGVTRPPNRGCASGAALRGSAFRPSHRRRVIVWIDAQLPPQIAPWIGAYFAIEALTLRDLGLRDADDINIFLAARAANAVVMTKDSDFIALLDRHGPPPQVIWLTCGNTSNARLPAILLTTLPQALVLLAAGERLIEIRAARPLALPLPHHTATLPR